MTQIARHEETMFSYSDLQATDINAARDFYTELFRWGVVEAPLPDGTSYVMFTKNDFPVAAASPQQPEQRAQGIPPSWATYFTVYDLEHRTKQAEASGGTIVAPPFDVLDVGRMSVIADPNGAVFCLWEPKTHIGAQLMNEPETLCWT
ncbi:MAG: VOC family protein, partial [Actinomycetota bacterium]|nr:VOC family protein [Actinomycetota bacterium]